MSNVTLSIGGREYKVACAAGEEAHVAHLGQIIDAKIASMDGIAAQGESRALLFAALLLADELHEARSGKDKDTTASDALARWLEQFAGRVENLASRLESDGQSA